MKTSIRFYSVFIILFSFPILFISCSQEGTITSPSDGKATSMAKAVVIPTVQFNHTADTLITLPKSGKTLHLSKNYTTDQLAKIDNYLTTHSIGTSTLSATPNLRSCTQHVEAYWEQENLYRSIPGKYLGIWIKPNVVSWDKCHDQYGFTNIFATFDEAPSASPKYQHDSIMIHLDQSMTQSYLNSQIVYSNYYVDEPYEKFNNRQTFTNLAYWVSLINPNAQFFFADWWWPDLCLTCYYNDNGNDINTYYFPNSNVHILCDKYSNDGCGSVHQYWDRYKSDYGYQQRNKSNWVSLDYSFDWVELYNVAAGYSSPGYFDHLWVYGYDDNVNESYVQAFDAAAWQGTWLLRYERYVIVAWECSGDCTNCNWPSGNWSISAITYSGDTQWNLY